VTGETEKPHHADHRRRLRERFRKGGADSLPDYELLELVLFQAIPRRDVKPLAKDMIKRFGSFAEVISAPAERLAEVPGVGEGVATELHIIRAAAHKLIRGEIMNRSVVSNWSALLDYCRAAMAFETEEQVRVLFLDRKNAVMADEVQQTGTVDQAPIYPREVAKRAITLGASALILVHNHPSGDPTPSRADIDMTKQLAEACKSLGIALHDHVVIGRQGHASFKALGLI